MQLTDYEQKAIAKLQESVFQGKWSNDGLVQLIHFNCLYIIIILLSLNKKK